MIEEKKKEAIFAIYYALKLKSQKGRTDGLNQMQYLTS